MTTNKPRWWQSWIVYAIVGVLVTIGPYVGGYFLLSDYKRIAVINADDEYELSREFNYDRLVTPFLPLGWIESEIRGIPVCVEGSTWGHI